MIREILYEAVALVVFTLGGTLSGITLLKLIRSNRNEIKYLFIDFLVGISGAICFVLLSEIYYDGVVTYYTISCFAIGYAGILIFFGEGEKLKFPSRIINLIKKVKLNRPKTQKHRQKKKRDRRVSKPRIRSNVTH